LVEANRKIRRWRPLEQTAQERKRRQQSNKKLPAKWSGSRGLFFRTAATTAGSIWKRSGRLYDPPRRNYGDARHRRRTTGRFLVRAATRLVRRNSVREPAQPGRHDYGCADCWKGQHPVDAGLGVARLDSWPGMGRIPAAAAQANERTAEAEGRTGRVEGPRARTLPRKELLDAGAIEPLATHLREIAAAHTAAGARAREVQTEAESFATNTGRMRYPEFRRKGLFVGSGGVEAGGRSVIASHFSVVHPPAISGVCWDGPPPG
jgi:hypothetical protein